MESINRWYDKTWTTKGARFVAAKRNETHAFLSVLTLSLYSCYLIGFNMYIILFDLNPIDETNFSLLNIILSIILLIMSIIISSQNYKYKSHRFHDCSREITSIYDTISYWKHNNISFDKEKFEMVEKDYNTVLNKYDLNHSRIDLKKFKSENIKSFVKQDEWHPFRLWLYRKFKLTQYSMGFYLNCYLIYLVLNLLPIYFFIQLFQSPI